ncbi:MAG: metal ABC transporter ATP-binding protein [Candidatus Omnitrophota bacterium]
MTHEIKKIIELKGLCLSYGRQEVVRNLNLVITAGDFLGIIGPNGTGKTTILKAILGLIKPQKGEIIKDRMIRFGYCIQRQTLDEIFPFTAFEIVMMGRTGLCGPLVAPGVHDRQRVSECLKITGIENLAEKRFAKLSGGQKQRILLARALVTDPTCLILDEPTTDLDILGSQEILDLVKALHENYHLTVILVSHELNKVLNYSRSFLFLGQDGKAIYTTREELDETILQTIFGFTPRLKRIEGQMVII